jgi:hypothetical protein
MNDAAQNASIIDTRHTAHIIWQQRLDFLELLCAEPEQVAHRDLQEKYFSLNHKVNPLQTLLIYRSKP